MRFLGISLTTTLVLHLLTIAALGQESPEIIRIEIQNRSQVYSIIASGISDASQNAIRKSSKPLAFRVWVAGVDRNQIPPMPGTTTIEPDGVRFTPSFPFKPGMRYDVEVELPLEPILTAKTTVAIPAIEQSATRLVAVYPSADELPQNLLKFYLHFSSAMRKGDIYQYLKIRERIRNDAALEYREVDLPFLEIEQEFWSLDSKRLTLLLDPGRIKRGLKPRKDMGPILEEGREYELVIDPSWPDANGNPLSNGLPPEKKRLTKVFVAGKEDRQSPRPLDWRIEPPAASSTSPLVIRLDEPLDSAMLHRVITVMSSDGQRLVGSVELHDDDATWMFVPTAAWKSGQYRIQIDNRLEDRCGNSIAKLFDVDVFDKTEPTQSGGSTELRFEIE